MGTANAVYIQATVFTDVVLRTVPAFPLFACVTLALRSRHARGTAASLPDLIALLVSAHRRLASRRPAPCKAVPCPTVFAGDSSADRVAPGAACAPFRIHPAAKSCPRATATEFAR